MLSRSLRLTTFLTSTNELPVSKILILVSGSLSHDVIPDAFTVTHDGNATHRRIDLRSSRRRLASRFHDVSLVNGINVTVYGKITASPRLSAPRVICDDGQRRRYRRRFFLLRCNTATCARAEADNLPPRRQKEYGSKFDVCIAIKTVYNR